MPNVLNLLPHAISAPQERMIHAQVSVKKPTPTQFTDPLYVEIPNWADDQYFVMDDWPAIHGPNLPRSGAACLLIVDDQRYMRCVWWDGGHASWANPALPPVQAVATSNVTLSGLQTIDSYALQAGDLVLAAGQTAAQANGLWLVFAGQWLRPNAFPSRAVIGGCTTVVENGSHAGQVWYLAVASSTVTIDTTAETWHGTSPSGVAGGDLTGTYPNPLVSTWGGQTQAQVVAGNPPQAHASSHLAGGTDYLRGVTPIGSIVAYAGQGDPSGLAGEWLIADGRLIDRTTYAAFFTVTGHVYNNGIDPGGNKVKIPDKRGRTSLGALNMGSAAGSASADNAHVSATNGSTGGESTHLLGTSEMPSHTHSVSDPGHAHGISDPGHVHAAAQDYVFGNDVSHAQAYPTSIAAGHTDVVFSSEIVHTPMGSATTGIGVSGAATGVTIAAAGGGAGHNVVEPYEADSYLVRIA